MIITFDRIKEVQSHFMKLNHVDDEVVKDYFYHWELEELIEILGKLLYFMHMTNKEDI